MATTGLKYPVFMPITSEEDGRPPVYGKGVVFGHLINAEVRFTYNNSVMYGDDVAVESDNSVTGGSINTTVDQITNEAQETALGYKVTENEDGSRDFDIGGAPTPYGGFAYITGQRLNGKELFRAILVRKIQFSLPGFTAQTKTENVAYQPDNAEGKMMGSFNEKGEPSFVRVHETTTEQAAKAWINEMAGITE